MISLISSTILAGFEGLLISILFLGLLFIPMEKAFPAKAGQKIFRRHWLIDLSFMVGQYLIWSSLVIWVLDYLSQPLTGLIPSAWQSAIRSQPFWLQVLEMFFFSDLLIYWGHRLQHRIDFLWRFHKVHHSAEHLDWLASHREHPLDSLYTIGLINLPAFIMGFPLESIAGVIAFRGIWAIYIHSNVRLPLGPLRVLIGAPELHHWHHNKERDTGNYANISPLMDVLFGTYVCPDHEPEAFGLTEEAPATYAGQLVKPVVSKKAWERLTRLRSKRPLKEEKKVIGY
ncbi:sterol desaturase family protein [Roseivirga sp. BDSF3-8]|uniref:sterol desaturase family protein n=1 Tax=Roseivirga sp. BDSF3-8 TaxID=3241598 RepID=UPI00353273CA